MSIYKDEEGKVLNKKFADVWTGTSYSAKVAYFKSFFKASPFYASATLYPDSYIDLTFAHLWAQFQDSQIASKNEEQFKFKIFAIMATDGIIWVKKQQTLQKLLQLTDDEIRDGGISWSNMAVNPGDFSDGKTGSDTFLDYINNQNTMNRKNSKLDALSAYTYALHNSTKAFIDKFKKLFMTVVDYDYIEYVEPEED